MVNRRTRPVKPIKAHQAHNGQVCGSLSPDRGGKNQRPRGVTSVGIEYPRLQVIYSGEIVLQEGEPEGMKSPTDVDTGKTKERGTEIRNPRSAIGLLRMQYREHLVDGATPCA